MIFVLRKIRGQRCFFNYLFLRAFIYIFVVLCIYIAVISTGGTGAVVKVSPRQQQTAGLDPRSVVRLTGFSFTKLWHHNNCSRLSFQSRTSHQTCSSFLFVVFSCLYAGSLLIKFIYFFIKIRMCQQMHQEYL